jgi:hypothetical protein
MNAKVLALYPALMLLATPATAGVTFTYTGYVVAGYDETGIFGTPNTSLTGDAFTLTFSASGSQILTISGFTYEAVGPLSAAITITGNTYIIPQTDSDDTFIYNIIPGVLALFAVGVNNSSLIDVVDFEAEGSVAPDTLTQSFNYSFGPPSLPLVLGYAGSGGIFMDCTSGCATPNPSPGTYSNYAYLQSDYFGFIGPLAPLGYVPVPEPATWAMMLLGFAGLAYVGYRRSTPSPFASRRMTSL